jgi:hypothetical protein
VRTGLHCCRVGQPGGGRARVGLLRRHQPLEPRVPFEWGEVGVDPKPAGREVVCDFEQRLQLIQRLFRFAREQVDAAQHVLLVVARGRLLGDGLQIRP